MEKISVIVPIYNVEKYLEDCIKSIISQDYKNIEIILINDGSTDGCEKIIEKYKKKDSRIEVINKKNGGLSDARNVGLVKATGKYICFVDSDDFVSKDFVSSMYNNIKKYGVDIAACGSYKYFDFNNKSIASNFENIERKYSVQEAHKFLHIIGYFNFGMWNKMYTKELFENIKFPKNKKSEDVFIMHEIIDKSNGLYYSSDPKYYYRQREGSITNTNNINYDIIEAATKDLNFYIQKNMEDVIPYAIQYLVFGYIGIYNALLCRFNNKEEMKKIRKEVLSFKNKITYSNVSSSRKIQLFLFFHFEILYKLIFKIFDYDRKKRLGN